MNLKIVSVFLLMILVSGCSSIKSINKLGETPYVPNITEWEGTWVAEGGALQLQVIDQKQGQIEILFIDSGKLHKYRLFLTQSDKDTYMNFLEKQEDKFYYPVKFKKKKNQVIIWLISESLMKKAISNKTLAGVITKHKYSEEIQIKASKKDLNRYFSENSDQMLFNYNDPFILRRLVK